VVVFRADRAERSDSGKGFRRPRFHQFALGLFTGTSVATPHRVVTVSSLLDCRMYHVPLDGRHTA